MGTTCVITSCGRWNLLNETISSFMLVNDDPIEQFIVIDNSCEKYARSNLKNIVPANSKIIVNEENIGQVASIDLAYSFVQTPYIFHMEDDWKFFSPNGKEKENFIYQSKILLEAYRNVMNVNVRVRDDKTKGSEHPVSPVQTINNINFVVYSSNHCGVYHGFSWNPGLRRLEDYKKIENFKKFGSEEGMNQIYYSMGYVALGLEKGYCTHIGEDSETHLRNQ